MKKAPPTLQEKEYFLLRWPVILIALLLAWPIGIILLITRFIGTVKKTNALKVAAGDGIPFARYKTMADKQGYDEARRQNRKLLITVTIMTTLFIVLGCFGVTGDYRALFAAGFSTALLRSFVSHAVFLLLGLYLAARAHSLLGQHYRQKAICAAIGEKKTVSLSALSQETGLAADQLRSDVEALIAGCAFGHGACLSGDTLHCVKEENT